MRETHPLKQSSTIRQGHLTNGSSARRIVGFFNVRRATNRLSLIAGCGGLRNPSVYFASANRSLTSAAPQPRLGAGPNRQRERQHAEDHRDGGHDDGAQADTARHEKSLAPLVSGVTLLVGEVDEQDAVLRDEPHE